MKPRLNATVRNDCRARKNSRQTKPRQTPDTLHRLFRLHQHEGGEQLEAVEDDHDTADAVNPREDAYVDPTAQPIRREGQGIEPGELAVAKPAMKNGSLLGSSVALNAPNIMVPSTMACGFSHVTTKDARIILAKGWFMSLSQDRSASDLMSPTPMHITSTPPRPSTMLLSQGRASINAPAPKKQAKASETSQNTTTSAVAIARPSLWLNALLMTNSFCIPIGARYARPNVSPWMNTNSKSTDSLTARARSRASRSVRRC